MNSQEITSVFCYAEPENDSTYRYTRIPELPSASAARLKELWISEKLSNAERALSGGKRHALMRGVDSVASWALIVHVAEKPAPDGRAHIFTHLVACSSTVDALLLEYALLKSYDGCHNFARFGNKALTQVATHREECLRERAADVARLIEGERIADLKNEPNIQSSPVRSAQQAVSSEQTRLRSTAVIHSPAVFFVLVLVGAAIGSAISSLALRSLDQRKNSQLAVPSREIAGGSRGGSGSGTANEGSKHETSAVPESISGSSEGDGKKGRMRATPDSSSGTRGSNSGPGVMGGSGSPQKDAGAVNDGGVQNMNNARGGSGTRDASTDSNNSTMHAAPDTGSDKR